MEKQIKEILEALNIEDITPWQYTILENVISDSYDDGYYTSHDEGYKEGYDAGHIKGYSKGFLAGCNETELKYKEQEIC